MARPTPTTPFQEELYAALAPLADQDAASAWALLLYVGGIASMFDQIETYARDDLSDPAAPRPGWAIIMDADRCPPEALPWLAQFVGVDDRPALADVQRRAWIKGTGGMKRGTPSSLVAAAKQYLTGSQTVILKERDPSVASAFGGAYGLTVLTYTSETPDTNAVLNALLAQKPAGIILAYSTVTGWTYLTERTTYTTYTALRSAFATYTGLRNNAPGT